MKINLATNQFLDDAGRPLSSGRISVFGHASDTPVTLYTLAGGDFTEAQNPYTMDADGRIPTLWFDDAVVDVKIEKFIEPNAYVMVDTYEAGFKLPEVINDTILFSLADLKDANTELGTVGVVGYDSSVSAPYRTYKWFPTCSATADDGIVVESNSSSTGRWVLDWPDDTLPCTVYGVAPGHEANMAALLNYQETVMTVKTPPKVRFIRGTYASTGTFSTSKTLVFDKGAKFTSAKLNTPRVEIAQWDSFVADFGSLSQTEVAHSSWFRTARAFFACSAKALFQDTANYFTDTVISQGTGVQPGTRFMGQALNGITFSNQGHLILQSCEFDDYSLSNQWKCIFYWTIIRDSIFRVDGDWDFGAIPQHNLNVTIEANHNNVVPFNFTNMNVYMNILVANGSRVMDLAGGAVGNVPSGCFDRITNGSATRIVHTSGDLVLDNMRVGAVAFTGGNMSLIDSQVTFGALSGTALSARDSYITVNTDVSLQDTTIGITGSQLVVTTGHQFWPEDPDNLNTNGMFAAKDCTINNLTLSCNAINITGCTLDTCTIIAYPRESILGGYSLNLVFNDNSINGTLYIEPAPGLSTASEAHDCGIVNLEICRNRFLEPTVGGVVCPYWAQDGEHRFIAGSAVISGAVGSMHVQYSQPWHIKGNTGYCPDDCPDDIYLNNTTQGANTDIVHSGTDTYAVALSPNLSRVFCLPADSADTPRCSGGIELRTSADGGVSLSMTGQFPGSAMFPACALDNTLPNDMFMVRQGFVTSLGSAVTLSHSKSC